MPWHRRRRDSSTRPAGPVDLAAYDPHGKPGFDGDKKPRARRRSTRSATSSSDLQERLFAEGMTRRAPQRSLLVLQGMDTSGKGGIVRHAVGLVDPQGVHIKSFKAPTRAELRHDFLWRDRARAARARA